MKVTSCLVLAEAAKQRGLTRHLTALGVGEFEVATSGGIWVAIRDHIRSTAVLQPRGLINGLEIQLLSARLRYRDKTLLLVRVFRSLDPLVGSGAQKRRAWMRSNNKAINGTQTTLIETPQGLVTTLVYLDGMRAAA